jgi:hypothetical protein
MDMLLFYPMFPEGREHVTKWLKDTSKGDKCQVEDMQYILLDLVFFWALLLLYDD